MYNVDVHRQCNDAQESHEAAADKREARCSVLAVTGEIGTVAVVVGPGAAFLAKLSDNMIYYRAQIDVKCLFWFIWFPLPI